MKLLCNYACHCILLIFTTVALVGSTEGSTAKVEELLYLHMEDARFAKIAETVFRGEARKGAIPSDIANEIIKEFSATNYIQELAKQIEGHLSGGELNELSEFFTNPDYRRALHELMAAQSDAGDTAMKQKIVKLQQDDPTTWHAINLYLSSDVSQKFNQLIVEEGQKLERKCFINAAMAAQENVKNKRQKAQATNPRN